jgi:hypothetical protein
MGISEDDVRPAVLDARSAAPVGPRRSSIVTHSQRIVAVEHRGRKTIARS